MTREELFEILGDIDDEYVAAAEAPKRARPWLKWGAIAACLCLVTAVAVFARAFFAGPERRRKLPLNTTIDNRGDEILLGGGSSPVIHLLFMLEGRLYSVNGALYDNEPDPTDFDGITTGTEMSPETEEMESYPLPPTEDGQANFGAGYGYKLCGDNTVLVYVDGRWLVFVRLDEDAMKRVMESDPIGSTLGVDDFEVAIVEESAYRYYTWIFYAVNIGGKRCNIRLYGRIDGSMPQFYSADLDGDGVDELICNCVYGDGGREVVVYRNNNGVIEEGHISGLYEELGAVPNGLMTWNEWYKPKEGFVVMYSTAVPDSEELEIKTYTFSGGLEHFDFYPYIPTDEQYGQN